jgi:hypothetical protein
MPIRKKLSMHFSIHCNSLITILPLKKKRATNEAFGVILSFHHEINIFNISHEVIFVIFFFNA